MYLSGPQQSWGCSSKFNERDTERFPTYSGIIGLIACAMGIERDDTESLAKLSELKMSVRIDQAGELRSDWQVAHKQKLVMDKKNKTNSACHKVVSDTGSNATYAARRSYLSDAKFVVGLTGENEIVERIASAVRNPKWAPYLGRKAFVPDAPLFMGIAEGEDILAIFRAIPLKTSESYARRHRMDTLPLWVDGRIDTGEPPIATYVRKDMPVSFSSRHRRYLSHVFDEYLLENTSIPNASRIEHDPMDTLLDFNSRNGIPEE